MSFRTRFLIQRIDTLFLEGRLAEPIELGTCEGQVRQWEFEKMKNLAWQRYPHLAPLFTRPPLTPWA